MSLPVFLPPRFALNVLALAWVLAQSATGSALASESVTAVPSVAASSAAIPSVKASKAVKPIASSATAKLVFNPSWRELTAAQQLSLKPLAANWDALEVARKRKWLALAANYASLPATEQAKLHSRMKEWAALSQQQRSQARLNFDRAKQISPQQKSVNWEAYQALSAEEKKKLAAAAPPKPVGAATATKPVSAKKLTKIAVTRQTSTQKPPKLAVAPAVNSRTLLPYPKPPLQPVSQATAASAPQKVAPAVLPTAPNPASAASF